MDQVGQDDYENFFGNDKPENIKQPFLEKKPQQQDNFQTNQKPTLTYEQLLQKEKELKEREEALNLKETVGNVEEVTQEKKPNFPICYPIIVHDIRGDIPTTWARFIVYQGLFTWIAMSVALVLNVLTAWITVFCPVTQTGNGIGSAYYSIKFVFISHILLVAIPLHFVLCYYPLYMAVKSLHVARFMIFFFGYVICMLTSLFAPIGYYDFGFSGLLLTILYAPPNGNSIAFTVNLLMSFVWIVLAVSFISIFVQVIALFRRENLTIKNVTDFVKDSVSSGTRTVVTSGVSYALQSQNTSTN